MRDFLHRIPDGVWMTGFIALQIAIIVIHDWIVRG